MLCVCVRLLEKVQKLRDDDDPKATSQFTRRYTIATYMHHMHHFAHYV